MGTHTFHYRLHDLASLRLSVHDATTRRARMLDMRFSACRAAAPAASPDVALDIGAFQPDLPGDAVIIDKDFHIAPDYLFFRGGRGGGATELRGLEPGAAIRIRHEPYRESLHRRLGSGLRGMTMYLDPMIAWHLRQHDAWLLHAGAIQRGATTVLVLGSNGAGKTRLILDLCLNHGWSFLADDLVIYRDGLVYPCPEHEFVLQQRALAMARGGKPSYGLRALWSHLGNGAMARCERLHLSTAPAPVTRLAILDCEPAGAAPSARSADPAELWDRAVALEQFERVKNQRRHRQVTNITRFLMAYEYACPHRPIFRSLLLERPTVPAPLAGLPACRLTSNGRQHDELTALAQERWAAP